MSEKSSLENIKSQFRNRGYKVQENFKVPKSSELGPDFVLKKDEVIYFVLIRSNSSISKYFLERITKIPVLSYEIKVIVVFETSLTKTQRDNYLKRGIRLALFLRGKLSKIYSKEKIPLTRLRKVVEKKLSIVDVFISSKQEISEREFIREEVIYFHQFCGIPFNVFLIEYHKYDIKKIYEQIRKYIDKCDWVIIVLEDNFSKIVKYEIEYSFKQKMPANIFIFAKQTKICLDTWKKEIKFIKRKNSVKYLPYNDLVDLRVTLAQNLKDRIGEMCTEQKCQNPFSS